MPDHRIPRAALWLGLAGLIPFLWSAAAYLSPALSGWAGRLLLDAFFAAQGLATPWWMRLRLTLTAIVLASLSVPILT